MQAPGFRWVIDPLDGTTNFSQGLPIFSVSIGVEYEDARWWEWSTTHISTRCSTPWRAPEHFSTATPYIAPKKSSLDHAVVSTGFPVDKGETPDNNLDNVSRIMPRVRGLRRLGSAAMDMCYVAAGFLDGYWELNLHRWDVSAAMLIVNEAGGSCTEFRTDRNISLVAASPAIHDMLLPLISTRPAQ